MHERIKLVIYGKKLVAYWVTYDFIFSTNHVLLSYSNEESNGVISFYRRLFQNSMENVQKTGNCERKQTRKGETLEDIIPQTGICICYQDAKTYAYCIPLQQESES